MNINAIDLNLEKDSEKKKQQHIEYRKYDVFFDFCFGQFLNWTIKLIDLVRIAGENKTKPRQGERERKGRRERERESASESEREQN